jgi:hypothetical protein
MQTLRVLYGLFLLPFAFLGLKIRNTWRRLLGKPKIDWKTGQPVNHG